MKQICTVLLACSLLFAVSACGEDDSPGSYTPNTTLPSRYAVEIPKTLKSTGNIPAGLPLRIARDPGFTPTPQALTRIKADISQFETMQQEVSLNFIIVDALMPELLKRLGGKSEITVSDLTVTLTQDMIDRMKEIIGTEFFDAFPEAMPATGTPFPAGTVIFKRLTGDPLYTWLITLVADEDEKTTMTLRWSEDKKRISINTIGGEGVAMEGGPDGSSTVFEVSRICTYDSDKKTSFLSFKFDMGTITMALAQTNEAKHGVIIKSTSRFNEGGTFNASETIGVADDDGGYLEATSKFDSTTISLRETFDGNGSNTGLLYKIEGQYNNEWQIATAIPEGNAYYSADPVSEFTVKEVKITVTGLASECDFFIAPAGTTTMDVNTTTLGSGRFDGVSMENTASWVYFWGTEADANGALIFVASWDGTLGKMQFTQTGGQVQIAP